eukprot:2068301-Karenia_brevis.AAC.1
MDMQSKPWFERVESSANISDKISRFDFVQAIKRQWRCTPSEDCLEALWSALSRTISTQGCPDQQIVAKLLSAVAQASNG